MPVCAKPGWPAGCLGRGASCFGCLRRGSTAFWSYRGAPKASNPWLAIPPNRPRFPRHKPFWSRNCPGRCEPSRDLSGVRRCMLGPWLLGGLGLNILATRKGAHPTDQALKTALAPKLGNIAVPVPYALLPQFMRHSGGYFPAKSRGFTFPTPVVTLSGTGPFVLGPFLDSRCPNSGGGSWVAH